MVAAQDLAEGVHDEPVRIPKPHELAQENAELVASVLVLEELQLLTLEVVVFAVVERTELSPTEQVEDLLDVVVGSVGANEVIHVDQDNAAYFPIAAVLHEQRPVELVADANAERSNSQIGVLVTLTVPDITEKEGKVSIMDWRSCRSPRVCRSTLAAEPVAADKGADRSSFVNMCLSQILHNIPARRAGREEPLRLHHL